MSARHIYQDLGPTRMVHIKNGTPGELYRRLAADTPGTVTDSDEKLGRWAEVLHAQWRSSRAACRVLA